MTAHQSIFNSSGKRKIISKGKKTISAAPGEGTAFMKHSALHCHRGNACKMDYILPLRKLRLREVADLLRGTKLVPHRVRTKPPSPGTKFNFWPHCPEFLFSNPVTHADCST